MSDEAELPKWARDELESLRRRLAEAEAERNLLVNGSDPSKCDGFWLEAGLGDEEDYPLPVQGRDLIYRQEQRRIRIRRVGDNLNGWLEINAIGGDNLMVRPWASNIIHVRIG